MKETIIEVRSLERTYRKGPKALDGVDLDVERGVRFALLGPNGAGKSTLTRILCTLSKADAGAVRICGIPSSAGSVAVLFLPEAVPVGAPLRGGAENPATRRSGPC